jgi:glycosyltransferase involved in cell wall biosynthesis
MKHISVVTACFNEAGNVVELRERIRTVFEKLDGYTWEHIFIDNASTDGTQAILRDLASRDSRVKVIFNRRNFGHVRSPVHAILQARGDAVVSLASDLQDPPELIPEFLSKWEAGAPVVLGVKKTSSESPVFYAVRTLYYRLADRLSDVPLIEHATGFGLYDRSFVEALRQLEDPFPYVRGLVSDLGFAAEVVPYHQPCRTRGLTKNNFFTLYDLAMVGITSHSKLPLRLVTLSGFALSALSFLVALGYLVYKLVFWSRFPAGIAPAVIGIFFLCSFQLFCMGLLGEYVAVIHTRVMKRPLVIEKERINFD